MNMVEDVPAMASAEAKPGFIASELVQVLKKIERNRRLQTDQLCKSLVDAMKEATSVAPVIQVGPKLPDFHKLSPVDDITLHLQLPETGHCCKEAKGRMAQTFGTISDRKSPKGAPLAQRDRKAGF